MLLLLLLLYFLILVWIYQERLEGGLGLPFFQVGKSCNWKQELRVMASQHWFADRDLKTQLAQ